MVPKLTDIRGVGPDSARLLEQQGFKRVADVAKASVDSLVAVQGFGPARAAQVIADAAALQAGAAGRVKPVTTSAQPEGNSGKDGNPKKKKKNKKKNKKKLKKLKKKLKKKKSKKKKSKK